MRLIDADKMKNNVIGKVLEDLIDAQPTAYDVDKIVEQLEIQESVYQKYNRQKNDYECGFEDGCEFAFDKAVDIVKGGVS